MSGPRFRYNSPEEFQALIRAEMAKWAKVIKAAGFGTTYLKNEQHVLATDTHR